MNTINKNTKIIVGISGGVDSSVAALLLHEQGFKIEGAFMKNWDADDGHFCQASIDLADARAVCDILYIKLHRINFTNEYWDRVFQYFLDEYAAGRTPNPDIICNKEIKFSAFLDYALKQGADYIATGHYARIKHDGENVLLLKGKDQNKDQSYFLYALSQEQLKHVVFPIGELEKPNVRKIARRHHLHNHEKKDSSGICFIGERKFKDFLSEYLLAKPGNIETTEGKIIGKHDGLMFYTIGQRQGIGIGGRKDANEEPWYVVDKDIKRNVLLITQGHGHPLLFKKELVCEQLNWIARTPPAAEFPCKAKIRYRQVEQDCVVKQEAEDRFQVGFINPQRAITPGQSVVFYDGDICLGGGIIV